MLTHKHQLVIPSAHVKPDVEFCVTSSRLWILSFHGDHVLSHCVLFKRLHLLNLLSCSCSRILPTSPSRGGPAAQQPSSPESQDCCMVAKEKSDDAESFEKWWDRYEPPRNEDVIQGLAARSSRVCLKCEDVLDLNR